MNMAVNTLFLIPGEVGGSETYLCETLLAIAREHPDVRLMLVTNRENDQWLRDRLGGYTQCSFHLLPIRATNRFIRIGAEQTWLPWLLRKLKPDGLWSPGYTMPCWAPCRQVVTLLDMQYRSHPDDLTRLAHWMTHVLVKMASRRADRILTISEFAKQEIMRHTGCPPARITVTRLGVNNAFAECADPGHKSGSRATTTHNPQPTTQNVQPYILSVANSYPHKNLHRLVEAFALLLDRIPHRLILVGQRRLGEPQLARALAQVPAERIERFSRLSRSALVACYQSADLFVFPSLYEGFGLPVLEAMMAGVPVVTTRAGSIPEIGGDAVVYADGRKTADLADQMSAVLTWSPTKRLAHIAMARQHATRFTWSATAEATLNAWRQSIH